MEAGAPIALARRSGNLDGPADETGRPVLCRLGRKIDDTTGGLLTPLIVILLSEVFAQSQREGEIGLRRRALACFRE